MNHPSGDELMLLAYGEVSEPAARVLEAHIKGCPTCREQFAQLERARVALNMALPLRRPLPVWAGFALAAAAVLAAVVMTKAGPSHDRTERWTPTTSWSSTAGYVTGGNAMKDIDAQLTRLEQEQHYGLPN